MKLTVDIDVHPGDAIVTGVGEQTGRCTVCFAGGPTIWLPPPMVEALIAKLRAWQVAHGRADGPPVDPAVGDRPVLRLVGDGL